MSMGQIDGLTGKATQSRQITTIDGYTFTFNLQYHQQQSCWLWSLTYQSVVIPPQLLSINQEITINSSNLLPFGIWCATSSPSDTLDPYFIDDLVSGRVVLYTGNRQDMTDLQKALLSELDKILTK